MYVAAGTDALDDLLTQVAALVEVQGAGLGGLLRELAVADIFAVERGAFEDAEVFEALGGGGDGSCGEQGLREGGDGCGVGPELEAGDEWAVSVDDGDRGGA